ncbi:MAG: condensation domain-containing protein, partial [Flammeovirgaceae bacterium]
DVLLKTRDLMKQLQPNQVYSIHRIIRDGNIKRPPGRNYLFDVTFSYHYGYTQRNDDALSADIRPVNFNPGNSKYDIEFNLVETDNGISGYILYDRDLFRQETIEEITTHFVCLADVITLNQSIDTIAFERTQERKRSSSVNNEFNFNI